MKAQPWYLGTLKERHANHKFLNEANQGKEISNCHPTIWTKTHIKSPFFPFTLDS